MTPNDEQWKPIPDFPGYEVSDQGRVRSYRVRVTNDGSRMIWDISDFPQRILRPSSKRKGYLGVGLMDEHAAYHYKSIHSLVMLAFVGPCPEDKEICHNDGNPTNNNLGNLRYDSHLSNMQDAISSGTLTCIRKFTPEDVLTIRLRRAAGTSATELAKEYGCNSSNISCICLHRTYCNVAGPITNGWLPSHDVQEIYNRCAENGERQRSVAKEYGISESTVSRIVNGSRRIGILSQESKGDESC